MTVFNAPSVSVSRTPVLGLVLVSAAALDPFAHGQNVATSPMRTVAPHPVQFVPWQGAMPSANMLPRQRSISAAHQAPGWLTARVAGGVCHDGHRDAKSLSVMPRSGALTIPVGLRAVFGGTAGATQSRNRLASSGIVGAKADVDPIGLDGASVTRRSVPRPVLAHNPGQPRRAGLPIMKLLARRPI